ncbi:MAG: DUF1294 domain-containing protein [Oscillospiraceae bacterium]|nr:DUF1294 domain-containing protein [Oscillospiraceae bacterium]
MPKEIIYVYAIWNVIVFLIYGLDKLKAKMDAFRIPEKTLITIAAVFGGVGAWAGMRIFRHKTRTTKFTVGVPLLALLNLAVIFVLMLTFEKNGIIM